MAATIRSASGHTEWAKIAASDLTTLESAATAAWQARNRKAAVGPESIAPELSAPMRLGVRPEWPGTGSISTAADILPIVTIHDMPASEYPRFIGPLAAYTRAELALAKPHLATALRGGDWARASLLVASTRAGIWAALGRAPDASASASNSAVRWSTRLGCLVVRGAQVGDGTETWRSFLASCQGPPVHASELGLALAGVAPVQFLIGAALLVQSGEVYAMHWLERGVEEHLAHTMSRESLQYLALEQRATWDLLSAAALGGFSVSIARALASDPVFVSDAHTRIAPAGDTAYRARADRTAAAAKATYRGLPAPTRGAPVFVARTAAPPDDDVLSVADTEADDGAAALPSGAATPTPVPPPPLNVELYNELTEAIRAVPAMPGGEQSALRGIPQVESVHWD